MKTNKSTPVKIEFTLGSSYTPLPGIRSADLLPNKEVDQQAKGKTFLSLKKNRSSA